MTCLLKEVGQKIGSKKSMYWIYYDRLENYCLSRQETMSTYSKAVAVGMEMRNIRHGKGREKEEYNYGS